MLILAEIERLIEGIYSGSISPDALPVFVYEHTFRELGLSLEAGFGSTVGSDMLTERAVNYRQNISRFSGAKTFQEVRTLSEAVFDKDGSRRSFAEFSRIARDIDLNYNLNWLKTESTSVFLQSQNARRWLKIEAEADIFPVLKYQTVGDARVRQSHVDLDGVTRPVNDRIWNRIMPQNGWNCRCRVIQLEGGELTSKDRLRTATKGIKRDFKRDDFFDYNVGKKEYIYAETGTKKHPYFKVPRKYRKQLRENFNF